MATRVSFILRHPSLDLQEVAAAIGLPIARIWTAGQPRRTPKGNPLEGLNRESYCAFKVAPEDKSIPAAIVIVDAALHAAAQSQPVLRSQELDKSLYCTLLRQGESVDVESLRRLVEWSLRLELD
jgi:hypothetical protein